MADPIPFNPSYDFSDFETMQPNTPKPGVQLDDQFANISDAILSHVNAIKDIRRSDGALKNGIVTEDSLEDGLLATLTAATRADDAEAAATAAEASADEAAATAAILESIADLIAAGGYYLDYGSITETASSALDYGSIA